MNPLTVYIAGPMRGIPLYNFPAFDAAEKRWRDEGHNPINPAALDRAAGVNEHTDPLPADFMRGAMKRDLEAICNCHAIALLPGWEKSSGVDVELRLACVLGLQVFDAVTLESIVLDRATMRPLDTKCILDEAKRLVLTDRNKDYGHPADDFARAGLIWQAILGIPITPEQVGLCMVGIKLSRECHTPKRDNLVDGAGYFQTVAMIHERKAGVA